MIHQERRKAMEAMEEAMNVQQQMRRYESKYINQSFIACYEKGVMKIAANFHERHKIISIFL